MANFKKQCQEFLRCFELSSSILKDQWYRGKRSIKYYPYEFFLFWGECEVGSGRVDVLKKLYIYISTKIYFISFNIQDFNILEAHTVIKYLTYTHIPIPNLDGAILTASCNKFTISAVRASCRNHPFTLKWSWFKYAFVLFFIVNIPCPYSSGKMFKKKLV